MNSACVSGATFREWGDVWIAKRKARGVISVSDEEAHLNFHAYPQLGWMPLAQITKAQMTEWVRGLPARTLKRDPVRTISPRYVHHVAGTVKRMLDEAAEHDHIPVNPCVWKAKRDLPPKRDLDPSKRRTGGFQLGEVWALLHDERIDWDRRVLYALEFLTGGRMGELSIRRWRDLDLIAQPLGRLEIPTAWNSRIKREKGTKTLVEKIVPVHPLLARILADWRATGWVEYVGREPTPDDLIVPAFTGDGRRPRHNAHTNKRFKHDLGKLGFRADERRTHLETRATFHSLAIAGGANRADVDLITHPEPRSVADLYTRFDVVWPALCRAVLCIRFPQMDDGE